jgi:hypothetical protein
MKILRLLKNPFIKNIGVILIIYFALFHNKSNPDSLGVRLSADNLKKGADELKNKTIFITHNVIGAQKFAEQKQNSSKSFEQKIELLEFFDPIVGAGNAELACGDEARISYQILNGKGEVLNLASLAKIKIGSKENLLLEKKIIGMKIGGTREIIIPRDFEANDIELQKLLINANSNIKYQINLEEITSKAASTTKCFS